MKNFNDLLSQEGPVLGLFLQSPDPYIIEMAKLVGFDFIRIDNEHIPFDYSDIKKLVRTANLLDTPVQVRVSNLEDITKLLDFGVTGIVVPNVNTVERAKEAISATKYYPLGARGMCPICRCVKISGYSPDEYFTVANDIICLNIQIEDIKAAEIIDEIVSLEGIDMISSGKADISQSAGIPGQTNEKKVIEMEDLIIKKSLEYGKQPVIMVNSRDRIKELLERGERFFSVGPDYEIFLKSFKDTISEFKDNLII
ncbi:MAG: HpcH/HpaI aldolase family protein [Eubacteriaceae bacterium]